MMSRNKKILSPTYTELIVPTYQALIKLGGSGTNNEICEQVIKDLQLSDEVVDESHLGSESQTELEYQLAWARTYLKNFGVIINSARSVWSITPDYTTGVELDAREIVSYTANRNAERRKGRRKIEEVNCENPDDGIAENGFTQVEVTKKSGDGGIDGTGKLKINGIFSFNVAFQCKRYKGAVGASDIRDFRGSLTTDIEKGVFITTGVFTKAAKEEASNPGKQQIDLIDGEEFINKIAQYGIGVREVITYEIDEEFFEKI